MSRGAAGRAGSGAGNRAAGAAAGDAATPGPAAWDASRIPRQDGRTIVVTGGSSGIGYFVVEQLAAAGARVVIAARSPERADAAIRAVRDRVGPADVERVTLDLSSLDSVRAAADELSKFSQLDALVNNAGLVIASRRRRVTADGLELVVGGNFIGHFALTALLFERLAPAGRVVGLGSLATRTLRADPDDLLSERRYGGYRAYAFSKHAVHGFAFELDRRLRARGDARASLLAHPGYAVSEFAPRIPGVSDAPKLSHRIAEWASAPFAQGKDRGAWPVVRAAVDPTLAGGTFVGPGGWLALAGPPIPQAPVAQSADPAFGARVWELAERSTGIRFTV